MITRKDFIEKLSEWLTDETCEKLAFEAEQRFTEDRYTRVYLSQRGHNLEESGHRDAKNKGAWIAAQADKKGQLKKPHGNARLYRIHAKARRQSETNHAYKRELPCIALAKCRITGMGNHAAGLE